MARGDIDRDSYEWQALGLPLPRLSEAHRQHIRRAGALAERPVTTEGAARIWRRIGEEDGAAIDFRFCPTCGCVLCWRGLRLNPDGRRRIAVNIRLADPEAVAELPIDHFDGLDTFDDLPSDGRCVGDLWF